MSQQTLIYKRILDVKDPMRGTSHSAGLDLFSPRTTLLRPFDPTIVGLGICVKLPSSTYGRLALRSSVAAKGITILGGVVDNDYTGELKAILVNLTLSPVLIEENTRIVQLICEKCTIPIVLEAPDEVWENITNESERKDNGFGSTDWKIM